MSRALIFGGALLFLVLGILSFHFVRPDKHSREPYDDHSADLSGEKAAREKLDDGSSCFELVGDTHELQFRLGRCLGEKMKKWPAVTSIEWTGVKTEDEFLQQVSRLRKEGVQGLPVMISETAPRFLVLVGCKARTKHLLGDLHDLLELASDLSKKTITEESLRLECD